MAALTFQIDCKRRISEEFKLEANREPFAAWFRDRSRVPLGVSLS